MGSNLSTLLSTQQNVNSDDDLQPKEQKTESTQPPKVAATTSVKKPKKTLKTVKKKIHFETPIKNEIPTTSTSTCSPPLKRALIADETICLSSDDDDFVTSVSTLKKQKTEVKDTQTPVEGHTPRKAVNKKLLAAAASSRKITEYFTKTPSKTPEKPPVGEYN
jgi:hypothetical protein